MEDFVDSQMWLARGSSIVFDKVMLGPLLNAGALVSLRTALGWLDRWPANVVTANPASTPTCKAVLIGGLDTMLEVLPKSDAEAIMRRDIRLFIHKFQDQWQNNGLVFGMNTPAARIIEDPVSEMVFFVRRDHERICLATELWNGSASTDMGRLLRKDAQTRQTVRGGYYAPRS